MASEQEMARILLEKEAVTLNLNEPYTYASGIRSPIYCDNRRMIFFPQERTVIAQALAQRVMMYDPDVVAGTASAGIPWAAWVAEQLEKPMVYIRKAEKGYGKQKLIEGGDIFGKTAVVIEDLMSTGGSSLNAIQACLAAGANVLAMTAIFTYEFAGVLEKFKAIDCEAKFLTNFTTLTQVAAERQIITQEHLALAREWNLDPHGWGPKHGFPNAEKNL